MGLRCLMGHDYGPLRTEREREDRGDEAVVTVREFKECVRCGHRRIVSENKEVTATGGSDSLGGPDSTPGAEGDATSASRQDVSEQASTRSAESTSEYQDVTAEEDDGVILEDDGDDAEDERQPGDWPDHGDDDEEDDGAEDDEDAGYDPWPEVAGEDEGYSAEPSDGSPSEDVSFGGGLAPETGEAGASPGSADEESTAGSDGTGVAGSDAGPTGSENDRMRSSRRRRSRSEVGTGAGQRATAVDATVSCPECDHTAPAEGSSLRPGDICPACRRGYLVERES